MNECLRWSGINHPRDRFSAPTSSNVEPQYLPDTFRPPTPPPTRRQHVSLPQRRLANAVCTSSGVAGATSVFRQYLPIAKAVRFRNAATTWPTPVQMKKSWFSGHSLPNQTYVLPIVSPLLLLISTFTRSSRKSYLLPRLLRLVDKKSTIFRASSITLIPSRAQRHKLQIGTRSGPQSSSRNVPLQDTNGLPFVACDL